MTLCRAWAEDENTWTLKSLRSEPFLCYLEPVGKNSLARWSLFSHFWLCDPIDCSMPGLPVPPYLLEFTQVHVWLGQTQSLLQVQRWSIKMTWTNLNLRFWPNWQTCKSSNMSCEWRGLSVSFGLHGRMSNVQKSTWHISSNESPHSSIIESY